MTEIMSDYGQYYATRAARMARILVGDTVTLIGGAKLTVLVKQTAHGKLFLSDLDWHYIEEVV